MVLALLGVAVMFGCSGEPTPSAADESLAPIEALEEVQDAPRYLWEGERRPYTVTKYDQKDAPQVGVQHRYVWAVVPSPDGKDQVLQAAEEIYAELAADIAKIQPRADSKRVGIFLFDSREDAEAGDGAFILRVASSSGAGPVLPEWDDVVLDWKWRSPEHRPNVKQFEIYRRYVDGRKAAAEAVDADYRDRDGNFIGTLEDQPEIDRRVSIKVRQAVHGLRRQYGLSDAEMAELLAVVQLWRFGSPHSPETIRGYSATYIKDWEAADELAAQR
ncbi:hypothetical protein [Alienimonas chondri]|nr:hypothetical protein [Alienimonas chondri]